MLNTKLHVGIFGPSLSGKTYLARSLSHQYKKGGILSIALDPVRDDWAKWPEGTLCTDDPDRFMRAVRTSTGCALFVDECGEMIKRNPQMASLFTWSRHNGHKMHAMGHDAASLLPVMRQQLTTLCMFTSTIESAKLFESAIPGFRAPPWIEKLNDYEFCLFIRGGALRKVKLKV